MTENGAKLKRLDNFFFFFWDFETNYIIFTDDEDEF